jgi:hypothetical protein
MSNKTTAVVLVCFCLFAAMAAGVAYLLQDLPPTQEAARATMVAALPATPPPADTTPAAAHSRFGPIAFDTAVRGGTLVEPGVTFPAGTAEVYAAWAYQDMVDGTPFHLLWYHDDAQQQEEALAWDEDVHGTEGQAYIVSLAGPDGDSLPPGNYRLTLYIGDRQVQEATFEILTPEL